MATDTESMHENMTRLRMRMVQQKLANERERLHSAPSENGGYDDQLKLQHAMLKRQELLDKIRSEQLDDKRPRTYTPRRRYTPSPLPPPSRRSLPDLSKQYHFVNTRAPDMAQVKHVIEHQFRSAPQQQQQQHYQLPPIQTAAVPQMTAAMPALPAVQAIAAPATPAVMPVPAVQAMPYSALPTVPYHFEGKGSFNKGDMMEMMMMQNAQMHHMVMQQMMLSHLPGSGFQRPIGVAGYHDVAPISMVRQAPSVYHHHINSNPGYQMPPDYYQQEGFW